MEAHASVGALPAAQTPTAARPPTALARPATLIARRVALAALGPKPCKARLDGQRVAMDAVHDAGEVPVAVRAPIAASPPIAPAGQVTTWPMGRLLRMEGVATKPEAPAVVGPRRGTRP